MRGVVHTPTPTPPPNCPRRSRRHPTPHADPNSSPRLDSSPTPTQPGLTLTHLHPHSATSLALHQQTGGPTAGWVSLRPKDLVVVLRWLRPGTRIAMGPAG
jgi:hypothetical protein